MKFGAMQGVLGEPIPQVFSVAKELGFDGVELDWSDPSQAQPGGPLGPEHRAEIRAAAQNAGVEIPSVAAHFLNRGGLASPDAENQRFGLEAVRTGIELCKDLGAKVLLVPFFGEAEIHSADDKNRLIENLQRLAPAAVAADVTLALEHSLPGGEAEELLAHVASTHVADYWDMANCMCFGYNQVDEIESLGRYLAQVHAKEYDWGEGPDPNEEIPRYYGLNLKPLGEGEVPLKDVMHALQRVGYTGYIMLETGAFGDRKESARQALEVLRQFS
jgi:hexulose-6-phosphate isomerase